jgi:hypothetical protein
MGDTPKHGAYHRTGVPGGPDCSLGSLEISLKQSDGSLKKAYLLNTDPAASEVEMLRTIAHALGVQWGHDDLGWWATIPREGEPQ